MGGPLWQTFGEIYGFLWIFDNFNWRPENRRSSKKYKSDQKWHFQGFVCYNPVRSAGLAKLRRELTDKLFWSAVTIFTWIPCLKHCFNICNMIRCGQTSGKCQCSKTTWCRLTKIFPPEGTFKRTLQWNFGGNLCFILDVKISRKYEAEQPPSWNHIIIECQRTRNPLSLILIFSAIKARGVLKSDYYVEEDPVWLCMQWLAGEKSTSWVFCNLLFKHFQFWKSTLSTAPHYLWVSEKKSIVPWPISSWTDLWCHIQATASSKQTIIDQWNQCIWSQASKSLHCCHDDMMNSHAWFMLMRHVCLWRKTLHDNLEENM